MKKTSFIRAWIRRSSLLLAAAAVFSGAAYGQANFWSIFGNTTTGCHTYNRMSCEASTSPSSFSGIMTGVTTATYDPSAGLFGVGLVPVPFSQAFQNSMYDQSGNLLFSVNADGIWDPSGQEQYDFTATIAYMPPSSICPSSTFTEPYIFAEAAISEICIVPNYGKCNSYYVVFWCNAGSGSTDEAVLRAVEVDINPAAFTALSYSTCYTFTNNILDIPDCNWFYPSSGTPNHNMFSYQSYSGSGAPTGAFEIAVNPNADYSIDIYTIDNEFDYSTSIYKGVLRKWPISTTGVLPAVTSAAMPSTVVSSGSLLASATTKAKIFQIPNATNTGNNFVFAYIAVPDAAQVDATTLQTYNLNTGDIESYVAPVSTSPASLPYWQTIWGFEYIKTNDGITTNKPTFIFTYQDSYLMGLLGANKGGFGYAYPSYSGTATTIIPITPASPDYCLSDLELDKNGDLFAVNYNILSPNPILAYIPNAALSTIISSFTAPTLCTSTTCGGENISIANYQYSVFSGFTQNYLGSQIRNIDYGGFPQSVTGTYTIPTGTSVTWTPSSNPIQSVSGLPSVSPISFNHIVIEPGASLTITSNLVVEMSPTSSTDPNQGYIDVYNSTSGSSSIGGRLVLTNATLTRHFSGCTSSGGLWGGVRLFGDIGQQQFSVPTSHQPAITMNSNSTISYAQTGVYVGETAIVFLGIFPYAIQAGGGIINATNSHFYNNNIGVEFLPYSNFDGVYEEDNISSFSNCTFKSDDGTTVTSGTLYGIAGQDVKGINISTTQFTNLLDPAFPAYGIYAANMGFTADAGCSFNTFTNGIYHSCTDVIHTAYIRNSTFTNNQTGAYLSGSFNPVVVNNTFNVPMLYYTHFHGVTTGLTLFGADYFVVSDNTFQLASGSLYVIPGVTQTAGVLSWNTQVGNEENLVNNNSFSNLGTANLSNFKNREYNDHGLWYRCNTYRNNLYDEATRGGNNNIDYGDGIRDYQGIPPYAYYTNPSVTYPNGFPSSNTFSSGSTLYNLYHDVIGTATFLYEDCSTPTLLDPLQKPGVPPTTGNDYAVGVYPVSQVNDCVPPFPTVIIHAGAGGGIPVDNVGGSVLVIGSSTADPAYGYLGLLNNVNYYLRNPLGITHRDSLYYWIGQLNSTAGKLAICNLLISDGYADSASRLYDSIPVTDSLDSVSKAEFNTWGKSAFNVQSKVLSYYHRINADKGYAYSHSVNPDSVLLNDTLLTNHRTLDTASKDTIINVFNNSRHLGRVLAENILSEFDPLRLTQMLSVMPDTFLIPNPDTMPVMKWPSGVLAVTELSQGPSGTAACQYAEMVVANCGTDASAYVDVSGWIIDDNSGNFDTGSCSATGITRGHYRLAAGDPGWQNIPVGSVLIIYNAANNCYNLPETFTVDTAHFIFWIPVNTTATSMPPAFAVQRYSGIENDDPGSYCSDTGTNVYTAASHWTSTIVFAAQDAVQVRCPGCSAAFPGTPPFYQGLGYAPDDGYCFAGIPAAPGCLGGPVVYTPNPNQKFVFTGSTVSDFADPLMWSVSGADTAGIAPPTLGNVDSALYANITNYSLGLPCCSYSDGGGGRSSHATNPKTNGIRKTPQQITVYPNPATMTVYFTFPPSGEVTIKLTDVTGRLMDQQTLSNATTASFNVSAYTPGIYLYQVITNGTTQTGKILVGK